MNKSNKLPLKKVQSLGGYVAKGLQNALPSDTTSVTMTTITSTQVFNK
jgi:hypothetical protein